MNAAENIKYALVTVVFEVEIDLLILQARSLDLYAPDDLIGDIIIINNSPRTLHPSLHERLLSSYGRFSHLVRVIEASAVSPMPLTNGWRSQQVLKLAIAEHIRESRYVILDAKTHLVYPLHRTFFETTAGLATVNVYSYEKHPLRSSLERMLGYFDLDTKQHVPRFTATVAPFVLYTNVVKELVKGIEKRSGRLFAEEFVRHEMTEFFLYSAWILFTNQRLEDMYSFHQRFCPIIWEHLSGSVDCEKLIKTAEQEQEPFFAVHRRAILKSDSVTSKLIAEFWEKRGLMRTSEEALDLIDRCRSRFAKHQLLERLRILPTGVVITQRRLMRQLAHWSASSRLLRRQ